MKQHAVAIWFFIGALLTVYGVLILIAGISELGSHTTSNVVLSNLHMNIWWGAGILIIGLIYLIGSWPKPE